MKRVLQSEEILKLLACFILILKLGFSYWIFLLWILAPDLSILAYTINSRVGGIIYNIFHHQGLAAVVCVLGLYMKVPNLEFAGLILLIW